MKQLYDEKPNQIVSFSGGKDSTAMAILHPEIPLAHFNTGWEFPEMVEHVKTFSPTILQPRHTFDSLAIKYGWPSMMRRWCTREKIDALNQYCKGKRQLIGFTIDEIKRCSTKEMLKKKIPPRFPLIERNMSSQDTLRLCLENGYTWNNLYTTTDKRISCYCCPLKGSPRAWQRIRKQYQELWERMLWLDEKITQAGNNRGFYGYKTVHDLEKRFEYEDRQTTLPL